MSNTQTTNSCAHMEEKLREAAEAYYNGTPNMSDRDYDSLWREHTLLRGMFPDDPAFKDTILDRVGAAPSDRSGFQKVAHSVKMESLDNAFVASDGSIGDVFKWLNRINESIPSTSRIIAEPKIDGLSLRVTYVDGHLLQAVTRGNGAVGDDVTANVIAASIVPLVLSGLCYGKLSINGEVYMPFYEFQNLCLRAKTAGEDVPANPRNAASGILRRKDPAKVAHQGLRFMTHGIAEGATELGYDMETYRLNKLGLQFPFQRAMLANGMVTDTSGVQISLAWLKEIVEASDYPVDGVVLKVCGYSFRDQLGSTSRAPIWAIAVKFQQEEVETTLNGITVQVGRTGTLAPVAELEPVEVDGTVVSRASLHNQGQINRLNLRIGDRVIIRKAGAIIPEVLRSVTYEELKAAEPALQGARAMFNLPDHIGHQCPSCGSGNIVTRDIMLKAGRAVGKSTSVKVPDAIVWACGNTAGCPAQLAARIEYMAGRDCLNLEGLGTEACDAIANQGGMGGLIRHPFDILEKQAPWFARLTWETASGGRMTFGESRAMKVVQAIKRAQLLPLDRWIASLGIHTIGKNTSKEITRLAMSVNSLMTATTHETGLFYKMLASHDGSDKVTYNMLKERYAVSHHLGPVSLRNLCEFVASEAGCYALDKIPDAVKSDNYSPEPPKEKTGALAGKTFVVTGTLSAPRNEIHALIEANGGKIASSISKSTDVLVAGDKAGSKLKKAADLGIPVWDEEQLGKAVEP